MATIKYQNPREKQVEIKRSGLLKKFTPILSDKLSQFKVKVSCENNGGQDIKNIKIELCKSYSSDEDIKEIKKIIINTGNFVIYPKVDDGHLLVSISLEKIDSFSGNSAKEVIVPLPKNKVPVGLVKDPLLIKKPETDQGGGYPRAPIKENVSEFSGDTEDEIKDMYVFINPDIEAGLKEYEPIDIDVMGKIQQLPIRPADISISGSAETKVSEKVLFSYGKNQNESQKEEIGEDFKKFRNAISLTLKSLGFNSPSDYISITSSAIGATINCKAESLNQMKTELTALYPNKIYAKEGKKTIQVLNSFMESYLENATNNGKSTKMQTIDFSNTGKGKDTNTSPRTNVLKPISLANAGSKIKQTQIQTIQNTEEMNTKKQDEIKEMVRKLLIDQEIKYVSIVPNKKRKTMVANIRDAERNKIIKLNLPGVEEEGGEKAIHFNDGFVYKSKGGNSGNSGSTKKNSAPKKKSPPADDSDDKLQVLFEKIRNLKSGVDVKTLVKNFSQKYPGHTLWLNDGETSKKVNLEKLLTELSS